jgi:pimeloyl-ACP methyl ester carboxylesterase
VDRLQFHVSVHTRAGNGEEVVPGGLGEHQVVIYVLPGMGADQRMYSGPWRELEGARFLDWPTPCLDDTIEALARRMVEKEGIEEGAVLIGSSFGGMVACEMARLRNVRAVFLVGSARAKDEVSAVLHLLHPLIDLAPLAFVQRSSGKLSGELGRMFGDSDPRFIRTMCRAIFSWNGLGREDVPVIRIHGRFDRVIPPPRQVDLLLDGGHLIAMSHAGACVHFITEQLRTLVL